MKFSEKKGRPGCGQAFPLALQSGPEPCKLIFVHGSLSLRGLGTFLALRRSRLFYPSEILANLDCLIDESCSCHKDEKRNEDHCFINNTGICAIVQAGVLRGD